MSATGPRCTVEVESIEIRREEDEELGLFIYAVAILAFGLGDSTLIQELRSGGLGDVEGEESFLALVGEEQRAELVGMLASLGLPDPDEEPPARPGRATMEPCGFCGRDQPLGVTHCGRCGARLRSEAEARAAR